MFWNENGVRKDMHIQAHRIIVSRLKAQQIVVGSIIAAKVKRGDRKDDLRRSHQFWLLISSGVSLMLLCITRIAVGGCAR